MKSLFFILLYLAQFTFLLMADDPTDTKRAGYVINALGGQFSCHFTIEGCDLFFWEPVTLPEDWKSQTLEKDLDGVAAQLQSKWTISKYPGLDNVYLIQESIVKEIKDNPLKRSLDSFNYSGFAHDLPAAISNVEPRLETPGLVFSGNIKDVSLTEGIHINWNQIPVNVSVKGSSIRDILTAHLPLDQYGPILWVATLHERDGKYHCLLQYGTFPLNNK